MHLIISTSWQRGFKEWGVFTSNAKKVTILVISFLRNSCPPCRKTVCVCEPWLCLWNKLSSPPQGRICFRNWRAFSWFQNKTHSTHLTVSLQTSWVRFVEKKMEFQFLVVIRTYSILFPVSFKPIFKTVCRMTKCRWDQGSMSSMRAHIQGHSQGFLKVYLLTATDDSKGVKWRHDRESCEQGPQGHDWRMTECRWDQKHMSSMRAQIQGDNQGVRKPIARAFRRYISRLKHMSASAPSDAFSSVSWISAT